MRAALALVAAFGCTQGSTTPDDDGIGGKADGFDSQEAADRADAVADLLDAVRDDAADLRAWLANMPKGADLHSHLSGAVATESLIRWGGIDGLCVNSGGTAVATCGTGTQSLVGLTTSDPLWATMLGAWSLEGHHTDPVVERHELFFAAFGKFYQATRKHNVDMLVDVRRAAARDGVSYLELMLPLGSSTGGKLGQRYLQPGGAWDSARLTAARAQILADTELATQITRTRADLDAWDRDVATALKCDTAEREAACDVEVRYLMQATRAQPRESVFGQFAYGFALAAADPRVVGLNLVQAEEDPLSLANYKDQMFAVGFMTKADPTVKVSLHAGELTEAFASADDRAFHVRDAVLVAGASRIGHAVDILSETDADALLHTMADRGVAVEACLTSNQQLLDRMCSSFDVEQLLSRGVPVALATDDQGILRSSMTDELVRAVAVQELDYRQLKRMVRASAAHSFLPGKRLGELTKCRDALRAEKLDSKCETALAGSERATLEWKLEVALDAFEHDLVD